MKRVHKKPKFRGDVSTVSLSDVADGKIHWRSFFFTFRHGILPRANSTRSLELDSVQAVSDRSDASGIVLFREGVVRESVWIYLLMSTVLCPFLKHSSNVHAGQGAYVWKNFLDLTVQEELVNYCIQLQLTSTDEMQYAN